MNTMTKEDLFTVTEVAKNKIIERLVTKYDVQVVAADARDKILGSISQMQLENQAMIRQINAQRDQSWKKMADLESQVAFLQREIQAMRRMLKDYLGEGAEKPAQLSDFSPLPVK